MDDQKDKKRKFQFAETKVDWSVVKILIQTKINANLLRETLFDETKRKISLYGKSFESV